MICPPPTWTGRVFEGWFTDPDNGTQVSAATQVTDPNPHTLYAHWRPAVYTITLTLNGGALDEGSGFTEASTGYWTGSYTFSATADFSLPTPTGAGAFEGWYDNAGLTGTAITKIPAGSTGEKAYYAKWNNDCRITYHNMEGHANHADNPDTYTPGGSFTGHTLLLPPEQDGWTFLGWYWDEDFTSPADVIPATQTGDVDLYAWWAEGKAHLITTQEELADIENHDNDIHFLMNDLTLESWTANFSLDGLFDGRGHTITYGSGCTRSLFGNLYAGAEVKNLKVEGALTPSYQYAGGIAEMVYGAITDCSANLTISKKSSGYCGGLAGLLYNGGVIRFTYGLPEAWEDISVAIDAPSCDYVGGLAGGCMGGAGQIANSSGRTVTVTADLSGYYAAGGIIGNSNLTELSGFAVTVEQIETAGGGRVQGAGGLVGYAGAAMTIAGCSVTNATADTITAPFVNGSKPEYNGKAGAFYGAAGGTVSDGGDNTLNGASADVSTGNPLAAASALRLPLPSEESEHSSLPEPEKADPLTPAPLPEHETLPEPALPPEGSSQPAEPDQEGEEPGGGLSAPEPES